MDAHGAADYGKGGDEVMVGHGAEDQTDMERMGGSADGHGADVEEQSREAGGNGADQRSGTKKRSRWTGL